MGASRDDYSWGSRREPPPRVIMFAGRLAFFSSQLDAKAQLAEAAKESEVSLLKVRIGSKSLEPADTDLGGGGTPRLLLNFP